MTDLVLMAALVCFFVLPAPLASWIGEKRSVGGGAGFLLGLLFSWLGVFAVLCFPPRPKTRRCPQCDERVRIAAKVCRYCRADLTPAVPPAGPVRAARPQPGRDGEELPVARAKPRRGRPTDD